jgi:hypothetical protein
LQALHRLIQQLGIIGEVHSVPAQFREKLFAKAIHPPNKLLKFRETSPSASKHITGECKAIDSLADREDLDDSDGGASCNPMKGRSGRLTGQYVRRIRIFYSRL